MKTRLFIGNLAPAVTEDELRNKFEALLSSHKEEAEVGGVEVRCKNEDNYFGYVDIHLKTGGSSEDNKMPPFLRKYVDLMNNTKWKGSLIKVQQAKESFIDKLRKEQGQQQRFRKHEDKFQQHQNNIKEDTTEKGRQNRQATEVLQNLNKSKERREMRNFNKDKPQKKFKKNFDESADPGFEIVSNTETLPHSSTNNLKRISPQKETPPSSVVFTPSPSKKSKKLKKKKKKDSSSDESSDSSDDEVKGGIPKFKGLLLSYPNGPPTEPLASEKNNKTEEKVAVANKVEGTAVTTSGGGVNFRKNKQERSDLLRLQSLEKLKELKSQRKNIIKSSLASVPAVPASTPSSTGTRIELGDDNEDGEEKTTISPKKKKSKMDLFNEDSDDEAATEDQDSFKIRNQFEGSQGQKLLELQTRWGNDDRFKIDKRFGESDNEEEEDEVEKEKEKQLDILTGILGKPVKTLKSSDSKKSKSNTELKSSVILPRYDPEAEGEDDETTKPVSKSKSKEEKKQDTTTDQKQSEEPIRTTEPVTFKTVSNLKDLFSSSAAESTEGNLDKKEAGKSQNKDLNQPSTFSLLAAYGGNDESSDEEDNENEPVTKSLTNEKITSSSASGPRNFWQVNPFKYDSSDDEDENKKNKKEVKVTIDSSKLSSENKSSSVMNVLGKVSFFFTKNDVRFKGLEDFFLKDEATPEIPISSQNGSWKNKKEGLNKTSADTPNKDNSNNGEANDKGQEDFSVKRQELKAIVKAKIRNSKRKDEKRTLAIKRALRKRKKKIMHHKRAIK